MTVVMRYESRGGKYWAQLEQDHLGFCYSANDGCGSFGNMSEQDARAEFVRRVENGYFLPDAAKTAMARTI